MVVPEPVPEFVFEPVPGPVPKSILEFVPGTITESVLESESPSEAWLGEEMVDPLHEPKACASFLQSLLQPMDSVTNRLGGGGFCYTPTA